MPVGLTGLAVVEILIGKEQDRRMARSMPNVHAVGVRPLASVDQLTAGVAHPLLVQSA
jgi:hypothetical protein